MILEDFGKLSCLECIVENITVLCDKCHHEPGCEDLWKVYAEQWLAVFRWVLQRVPGIQKEVPVIQGQHCKKWKIQKNLNMTKKENEKKLFVTLKFVFDPLQLFTFVLQTDTFVVFIDAALQRKNGAYKKRNISSGVLYLWLNIISLSSSVTHPLPCGGEGG